MCVRVCVCVVQGRCSFLLTCFPPAVIISSHDYKTFWIIHFMTSHQHSSLHVLQKQMLLLFFFSFFSSFLFVFGACWLCNLSVCSLILYISIFSESVTQSHHIIHHPENCTCLLKTHFKAHAHSVPFSDLQTAEGFHS